MDASNFNKRPLEVLKQRIEVLEHYEREITKALEYGSNVESYDQFCLRVLALELDVHELPNSVLFCEVSPYGGGKSYHVYVAVGDLEEILDFQRKDLIRYAKAHDCNALSFAGRLGWEKVLKNEGWKTIRISMAKEI